MALANNDDVEARLGRPLTPAEVERVVGLIGEASALVEGYCGRIFPSPDVELVPTAVRIVVSKLVARSLGAPADDPAVSGTQYTAGPFQFSQNFAGDGSRLWIGSAEKMMLRPYRFSVVSVPLRSEASGPLEGFL